MSVCCVLVSIKVKKEEVWWRSVVEECGGGVTDRKDCEESYIGHETETTLALAIVR